MVIFSFYLHDLPILGYLTVLNLKPVSSDGVRFPPVLRLSSGRAFYKTIVVSYYEQHQQYKKRLSMR